MGVAKQAGFLHLSPPAGRGRIASAIRVRGSFSKGGRNRFENACQIARTAHAEAPPHPSRLRAPTSPRRRGEAKIAREVL